MLREVELEAEIKRLKEANKRLISEIDHRDSVINSMTSQVNSLSLLTIRMHNERERFFLLGKEKKKQDKELAALKDIMIKKDQELAQLSGHNSMLKQNVTPLMQQSKELASHNSELMQTILDLKKDSEEKDRILNEKNNYFNMLVDKHRSDSESKINSILENDMRTIIELKRELDKIRSRN